MGVRKEGILQVNTGGGGPGTDVNIVAPLGENTKANSMSVTFATDIEPLPVEITGGGDATAANQVIGNTSLDSIDIKLPALVGGRIPVELQETPLQIEGTVVVLGTVTVNAVDLDIRALDSSTDSVDASGSTVAVTNFPATQPISGTISTKTDLTPSAPTVAVVGVASAQHIAAAATRKGLHLRNLSQARISLGFGSPAVLDSGITLYPRDVFDMNEYDFDLGAINAIASAAASSLAIQEYLT